MSNCMQIFLHVYKQDDWEKTEHQLSVMDALGRNGDDRVIWKQGSKEPTIVGVDRI